MAINFKRIEKVVAKTISDLGEKNTVTLQSKPSALFNASQPFEGPSDAGVVSYVVKAVVTPWNKTQNPTGIDISQADSVVYITGSDLPVEPTVGWLCLIDGVKYKILDVGRTKPGKTVLLWTLVVIR